MNASTRATVTISSARRVDFVAGKLDTTWDKGLRDLAGGGAVLAVEGKPGQAPSVFLIVTPRDAAFLKRALKTLVDLAEKDAEDKGNPDPIKQVEYRGITLYGGPDGNGAVAIVQDTLVITNHREGLTRIIDRALDKPKPGASIGDNDEWQAQHKRAGTDALAWGFVQVDRLRALDPKQFADKEVPAQLKFLFGSWIEAVRKAPWASARIVWKDDRLGAEITLPTPKGGYADTFKGFVPPGGTAAPALLSPPGTIANLSLWRNISAIWEVRAEIFSPEQVQGLTQLDTFAGQFFGGRDFGTGVLGALDNHWRLVVARQNYQEMKPVPDIKAPAFALVVDLKPDDDDFAQRLKVAFQSFVGLANLGAAQTKAPPLVLGSETFEGITIATSHFMLAKTATGEKGPVHYRHNFSPSIAQVENHFILSSSVALTRDLIKALKQPAKAGDATLVLEADGGALAQLVEVNHDRMVMQNMLDKGHDKAKAEEEVGTLRQVLKYLGHARLTVQDNTDTVRLGLNFALGK